VAKPVIRHFTQKLNNDFQGRPSILAQRNRCHLRKSKVRDCSLCGFPRAVLSDLVAADGPPLQSLLWGHYWLCDRAVNA